jgi:uncharacterized protein YaaW (UPF0174 family)
MVSSPATTRMQYMFDLQVYLVHLKVKHKESLQLTKQISVDANDHFLRRILTVGHAIASILTNCSTLGAPDNTLTCKKREET